MRSLGSRISFAAVLSVTMAASTFAFVVYSVLASALIDEFGMQRWQIGALVTVTALAGAIGSPVMGRLTDRIGARPATLVCLAGSGGSLLALAVSPVFWILTVFAFASGVAQSIANPATNKLISLHAQPGRRGIITGIKQSGVQAGIFVGGLTLPPMAVAFGWRWAVVVFAVITFVGAIFATWWLPADPESDVRTLEQSRGTLPPVIYRLAVYGFALGAGGVALTTYLPLFAEEQLSFPKELAGSAVAVVGLTAAIARIAWGRIAEVALGTTLSLQIMAWFAVAAACLLVFSDAVVWLVWPGAVLTGLSVSSWNTVGMLAVIDELPPSLAGRGSGIVLAGFLTGLAVGAPAMGWSVDQLETYRPGWLVTVVLFVVGLISLTARPSMTRTTADAPLR